MSKEIQVNLKEKKIRVYEHGRLVTEFADIVTGPHTQALLHHKGPFHLHKVKGITGKGLINFVQIMGNFGFHSDHWKHDRKHMQLTRIPGEHSHGCVRIPHAESKRFYDMVSEGDEAEVFGDSWEEPADNAAVPTR